MFGIGYQEMFIVLVVAMIIFGPSRLPELAGQVGRWVRDFRRMSSDLTGEFEKTFAEVDEVKKSFKREFDAIQDEVEGVGKSARGDLKKSPAKSGAAAKKPAALSSGTGAAKSATANGAKSRIPGLGARHRAAVGKNGDGAGNLALTAATKADPLADVSFFDADFVAIKNGSAASANGVETAVDDDALIRVRRRRAAAAYSRRVSA
jgi:Tat protein translocase TatB subunit